MEILKVLVVDDEPGIRSGVIRILRSFSVDFPFLDEGFQFDIAEATTGEEAIEFVDNNKTDIVLLDNKLPGKQGIEVLEYIKNKKYDILVVMITSHASLDLAVAATKNGAFDFVPKPFTPQELRTSIENVTKSLFLKRMTRQLNKEGKQIRFQFLSVLSHELKAPLNAIEGYLNIMKDRQVGDSVSSYEQMIERSLARVKGMRTLILDMLDLTKIESGKKNRELKDVDLVQIAQISIDTATPFAIQKDVKIKLSSKDSVIYRADAEELEIIFNNLISNAVKYNKDHGRVDVKIVKQEHEIVIEVKDSGIGLAEEDLKRLFNDFVRIKNEKTKNISGTGLGLSILKKLVDLYDGTVDVSSVPDEGTTFTITLPLLVCHM